MKFYRANKILGILLALSLLVLVVGVQWHVHDHQDGSEESSEESCNWCLAAAATVLLLAVIVTLGVAQTFSPVVPTLLTPSLADFSRGPWAPRAPPVQ